MLCLDRRSFERRKQAAQLRQGRTFSLEGHTPDRARFRHEPCRPPIRRRRRRSRPRHPTTENHVGQGYRRTQDSHTEEILEHLYRLSTSKEEEIKAYSLNIKTSFTRMFLCFP